MLNLEKRLQKQGFCHIAGLDEVGRGAWAGPVVAAAVVLAPNFSLRGLKDSKELTKKAREHYYQVIKEQCLAFAVVGVGSVVIDRTNIIQALKSAMQRAYAKLGKKPDQLLIDGLKFFSPRIKTQFIVRGDSQVASIAAASVIAKVTRDRLMTRYQEKFPGFSFASHKGYGTPQHLKEIKKYGPSKIHRFSYRPINEMMAH